MTLDDTHLNVLTESWRDSFMAVMEGRNFCRHQILLMGTLSIKADLEWKMGTCPPKNKQTFVNESQKVTSKIAQTWIQFHRLIGVILSQSTKMFQGSCLAGHLRKSVSLALFFTWFWVAQPCGWKYFGVGLSDQILAALVFVTSTEDNQCPHCPYAVSSSLLSNRASFPLYTFTPQEIHIWTPPKPAA